MGASKQNPIYTVYIISGSIKFNVTPALEVLDRSETDGQIAQRVDLQMRNVLIDGVWLSSILTACDRVYVYANDGEKRDEVFRGFIWNRKYKSSISDHRLTVTAYDHLIYLEQSEATYYFSAGKSTKDILMHICNEWGVRLDYDYNEMTHPNLPLKGKLYEIMTVDVLDPVKRHTGDKYVVLSTKDITHVRLYGTNTTIYQFHRGKNVTNTVTGWTMDGVVTQVAIVGKQGENEYETTIDTITGDTSEYGTLQKVISCDDVDNLLWQAKVEANNILSANAKPAWEFEINGPDIPWIRKGDKVYVNAGDIKDRYLYVKAVNRTYDLKHSKMMLSLEDGAQTEEAPEPWKEM